VIASLFLGKRTFSGAEFRCGQPGTALNRGKRSGWAEECDEPPDAGGLFG